MLLPADRPQAIHPHLGARFRPVRTSSTRENTMKKTEQAQIAGKLTRRGFLKAVAVSGGAVAGGSLLAGCAPAATPSGGASGGKTVTLDLTQPANQPLATVGGTLALDADAVDSQGLLLVRTSQTAVSAFSRRCTHQGCTVGAFSNGVSTCPCHGSEYDTSGAVVRGPAPRPLASYPATVSGDTVTVTA
jgi:cytochrome b6-f complex iron-sulfur subunit